MTRGDALQALGLDSVADHETIRRRYRRLCLKLHPDVFQTTPQESRADGAFLRVRDACEFFKENRSLYRSATAPKRQRGAEQGEDWHREMEGLLKRRRREQAERGQPSWSQSARDWWEKLGEDKTGTLILVMFGAAILVPPAAVLGAEYLRILAKSLTVADAAFGLVFVAACRRLARDLRAKP